MSDDALLDEIRDRHSHATAEWQDVREEAKTDMLCIGGQVWEAMDPEGVKQRELAKRVYLSLDELGQYTNQVVNEVRANPRGIKFSPTGNGANEQTAEFYANKTREIEYRSQAQMVYTTAFENTIQRSYGFCRVNTRRAHSRTTNREIWLEPFVNPDMVTPDPDALSPTSADMQYCFVEEWRPIAEFKRQFSGAQVKDFSPDQRKVASSWFRGERVKLAEYWKVKTRKRKLLILKPPPPVEGQPPSDPEGVFEDELEAKHLQLQPGDVIDADEVDDPSVCQYLTNGLEILDTIEWPGKYIPIISCYGKVLYLDDGAGMRRRILSMVRLARDPLMLYCYYRTQQAEMAAMIPKAPVQGYEGQFRGHEEEWEKAAREPVAFLQFKGTTPETGSTQVLPPPSRLDYHAGEHLQSLELCAEGARRAIQAAMGSSPLPSQAQRRNEKSGVALKKIDEAAQKGSFHFIDHYNDMIQQAGVIIEDLMPHIYDTARGVGIRKQDESAVIVRINDPGAEEHIAPTGDHLVTVATGPAFDSQRDEASDFVDAFVASPMLQLMGPKAPKAMAQMIRMKTLGVAGDQLADIIDPPVKDGERPDPAQLQQQLAEAHGKLQQLEQVAQQMKQALDTEAAKQQATVEKAKIDADNQIELQRMKNAAAIEIAEINARVKGYQVEDARMQEQEALALGHAHETHEAEVQRQHELGMATVGHAQSLEAGDQAHAQALEQGDQGVAGQLAVQAAQPEPAAGASAGA